MLQAFEMLDVNCIYDCRAIAETAAPGQVAPPPREQHHLWRGARCNLTRVRGRTHGAIQDCWCLAECWRLLTSRSDVDVIASGQGM